MALYPIRVFGDPVLRTPAAEVVDIDETLIRLADDMLDTMYDAPGVGLAAPQIGVGRRAFAVDVTGHRKARSCAGLVVLFDPEVLVADDPEVAREGCLSVPDLTGDVKRATHVVVSGQLPGTGDEVTVFADAFEARALQHEIDHCGGVLFLDRAAGAHAIHPRKTYL